MEEHMSRKQIREQIFKILFCIDFHNREEIEEQIQLSMEELGEEKEKDLNYIREKIHSIVEHIDEIDNLINENAEKWKTTRIAKAELTILRLAVYEMKYEDDIPVSVAINEAVELAKVYGADNGAGFVNGVLAKLV